MSKFFLTGLLLLFLTGSLPAFELQTRVYPADCETALRIKAVSPWAKEWLKVAAQMKNDGKDKFRKGKEWPLVGYFREDRRYSDGKKYITHTMPEPLNFKLEGNEIIVDVKLPGSEVHSIIFAKLPAKKRFRDFRFVRLLTLDQETFKYRPFKGNVHQHSNVSDGKLNPVDHVACARIGGMDFIGVSDHCEYKQNESVLAFAAECKSDLTVYPAEELHTPGFVLHSLSIGAAKGYSVRERTPEFIKAAKPELDKLIKQFPDRPKEELQPWAEALVLARRAKADGALVIYCHPAWRPRYFINNTFAMIDFIIRSKEFHAVEIINGSMANRSRRDNLDAWAVFHEICIETGTKIPVVSFSDSHDVSAPAYRRTYTLMFAPDRTFSSFKDAVISGRVVASYDLDDGTKRPQPLHLGFSKYVRYANFLDEAGYWSKHDKIAKKQGELIKKYQTGDKTVLAEIAKLAEDLKQHRKNFYYQDKK